MTIKAIIDENRKAPKQLRHWAERHGLYISRWNKRNWRDYPILGSRKPRFTNGCRDPKRFIRVLPHLDRMDICDGYMDRWANSLAASVPMPKTQAQFDAALATLLKKAKKRVLETRVDALTTDFDNLMTEAETCP